MDQKTGEHFFSDIHLRQFTSTEKSNISITDDKNDEYFEDKNSYKNTWLCE